jgi:predicted dehydrogenase
MNKKINAAIIGTGRMGQAYYDLLRKKKINTIGFLDNSKNNLKKFKAKNKISSKKIFFSSKNFFKIKNIDLIVISTTTDNHYSYIEMALKINIKYILVEKPLCRSLIEAQKILKKIKKKGTRLLVNHNQKETIEFKKIKKIANKFKLGDLKSMTVVAGNMGLAMNGIHYLDTFQHFTGKLLNQVSAQFDNVKLHSPRGNKFNDKAGVIISNNNINQKIIINAPAYQGHARQATFAFHSGIINLNLINGKIEFLQRKKKYINKPTYLYALPSINKNFKIKSSSLSFSMNQNLKKLLSTKSISNDLKIAIQNVIILVGCYISNSKNNKKINLKNLKSKKKFPWA